ncbi:uncharacterized protein LOC110904231 [Helianthus annuus]|uniref:uncharacterized protein LOC110904231 n=1 Tax=Helianthus annuus TaxID=4232 RepID=UPI0016533967|nr:uncharacterized protein LOC110904231 [Helianthus annuus]XP_035843737.1 uncharacterized protein LOC110904231 [Helianthus annuus]XP_035843738.1 uncharacterized protein LOC110904231 [Helianthus annuus]XP_035843739.1 uncharacterized protein LOC110904231 [Helianthus annuus]
MDQNASSDFYVVASPRSVNESVWQCVTGVAILHYSNSKGHASGPLPDAPNDVYDRSFALNQAMSISSISRSDGGVSRDEQMVTVRNRYRISQQLVGSDILCPWSDILVLDEYRTELEQGDFYARGLAIMRVMLKVKTGRLSSSKVLLSKRVRLGWVLGLLCIKMHYVTFNPFFSNLNNMYIFLFSPVLTNSHNICKFEVTNSRNG